MCKIRHHELSVSNSNNQLTTLLLVSNLKTTGSEAASTRIVWRMGMKCFCYDILNVFMELLECAFCTHMVGYFLHFFLLPAFVISSGHTSMHFIQPINWWGHKSTSTAIIFHTGKLRFSHHSVLCICLKTDCEMINWLSELQVHFNFFFK